MFDKTTAKQIKKMAELTLTDVKRCVLCTIPGCYRADLCSLPNNRKYRIKTKLNRG